MSARNFVRARLASPGRCFLVLVVLACSLNSGAQFFPQPVYVGIPTAQFNFVAAAQVQDEWCWAASTEMILNWYGLSVTQPQIVTRVFGLAMDQPASDQTISAALNGWGMTASGRVVSIRSMEWPGPPPALTLINELAREHPIMLTFQSGPSSGHAVVITAASYINTPSGPSIVSLVIRDPWPSPQNIQNEGRVEISGNTLSQFLPAIRSYWVVSVV